MTEEPLVWLYPASRLPEFFIFRDLNFLLQSFLTVMPYPKGSLKREYSQRDELPPPRSREVMDYGSRVFPDRRSTYREEYSSRNSGYFDLPRTTSRTAARRPYGDDAYAQRFERPPPSYREGRGRDYDTISGSKRPYPVMVGPTVPSSNYVIIGI